jgi:hypothetical protein
MMMRRVKQLVAFVAFTGAAYGVYVTSHSLVSLNMSISSLQFEESYPTGIVQQKTKRKSAAKFIFFIGIEGTGHHLMRAFLKGAPAVQRLSQLSIYPSITSQLQKSLYDRFAGNSLWPNAKCMETNSTANFDRVVGILRAINDKVSDHPITVPVNTLPIDDQLPKNPAGMM